MSRVNKNTVTNSCNYATFSCFSSIGHLTHYDTLVLKVYVKFSTILLFYLFLIFNF
jgi:hypothetical protein